MKAKAVLHCQSFTGRRTGKGYKPVIQWKILKKYSKFKTYSRTCDICLTEKLLIVKYKEPLIIKRTELMYKCPHASKYRLNMVVDLGKTDQ